MRYRRASYRLVEQPLAEERRLAAAQQELGVQRLEHVNLSS